MPPMVLEYLERVHHPAFLFLDVLHHVYTHISLTFSSWPELTLKHLQQLSEPNICSKLYHAH